MQNLKSDPQAALFITLNKLKETLIMGEKNIPRPLAHMRPMRIEYLGAETKQVPESILPSGILIINADCGDAE